MLSCIFLCLLLDVCMCRYIFTHAHAYTCACDKAVLGVYGSRGGGGVAYQSVSVCYRR